MNMNYRYVFSGVTRESIAWLWQYFVISKDTSGYIFVINSASICIYWNIIYYKQKLCYDSAYKMQYE